MGCGPCRGWGQRAERVCARVCTNVPLASVPERGVCVRTYCWGGSESHSGSCCFRVHIRTAGSGHAGEGEERAGDEAGKAGANQRRPPQPAAFIWQVPESTGPQGSAGAKLAMSPASCVARPGLGQHRL